MPGPFLLAAWLWKSWVSQATHTRRAKSDEASMALKRPKKTRRAVLALA
jgi:hypothetical protein